MTQPETADYRTLPLPIAPTTIAWQAWWEDHDTWDGDMLYADLDTAKRHSVHAYVCEEYSWMPGDDPDDEAPETVLTWELKYGRWRLLDGGQDTGVRLGETRTFAAPAGVAPAPDQTALRDRIAEVLTPFFANFSDEDAARVNAGEAAAALAAVLPASVDRADVRPTTLTAIANHLEARAVRVFRPDAEVYAEYHAVADMLRRVAAETPARHACSNCEGIDPETCLMNPDRPKKPPMDPVHILGIDAAPATPQHTGGNAEDCPACHGTNPPYPFICPGRDRSAS